MRRRLLLLLALLAVLGAAAFARAMWNARADPVVRRANLVFGDWPALD